MISDWILLEDNSSDNGIAQIFSKPEAIITAYNINEISRAFIELENANKNGKILVGFISYEFGLCFEEKTKNFAKNINFPLLKFYVFDKMRQTTSKAIGKLLNNKNKNQGFWISKPEYSSDLFDYSKKFQKIHTQIKKGDIYQANLTIKTNYKFNGSALALYEKLRQKQKVKYSAFIEMGSAQILSLSPELFFMCDNYKIETHPMKGTIQRGQNSDDDIKNSKALINDAKQRAENLMITDLMRNDLSKISNPGSVKVPNLFAIEKYESVFQMISKITANLQSNIKIFDILRHIAPAGSITGCPKIRAEEIIFETENAPRDIYCGAIGIIEPNGKAKFNVAIRTPIITNNKIEMGIGSGIVYDSIAKNEYEECKLKAQFLSNAISDFGIIETLLWTRDSGFQRLQMHLMRLKNAAQHFNKIYCEKQLIEKLENIAQNIIWNNARVRISIDKDIEIKVFEFTNDKRTWKIAISPTIMQSNNPWLYYKTTNRKIYDEELLEYKKLGFDEIIYFNEKNELTEGAISNIFLDFGDGILITPPIKSGLLNGILRQELLQTHKAIEKKLYLNDLNAAQYIYVGNSLRGLKNSMLIK